MRDPRRIKRILKYLETYWEANPDLRLGQIVSNLTPDNFKRELKPDFPGAPPFTVRDPFHVEDDVMEEQLRRWSS